MLPSAFRAGWAMVVEPRGGAVQALAASPSAPAADDLSDLELPLPGPRTYDADDDALPQSWRRLATEVAAVPLGGAGRTVLVGRPGGPSFRRSGCCGSPTWPGSRSRSARAADRRVQPRGPRAGRTPRDQAALLEDEELEQQELIRPPDLN